MPEQDNCSSENLKFKRSAKESLIGFLEKKYLDGGVIEGLLDKIKEEVLTCKLIDMYAKTQKDDSMTSDEKILRSPVLTPENRERLRLTKKITDSYKGEHAEYKLGIFMYDILAGQYKLEEGQNETGDASYRNNLKAVLQMKGDMNDFLFKKSVSKK